MPKFSLTRLLSLSLIVLTAAGCTSMFFQPDKRAYYTPQQAGLELQSVTITNGANSNSSAGPALHAWWAAAQLTADYAAAPPAGLQPKGTVLFLHGNAQNISAHIAAVHWLPKAGYNLLLLDYRGYGE